MTVETGARTVVPWTLTGEKIGIVQVAGIGPAAVWWRSKLYAELAFADTGGMCETVRFRYMVDMAFAADISRSLAGGRRNCREMLRMLAVIWRSAMAGITGGIYRVVPPGGGRILKVAVDVVATAKGGPSGVAFVRGLRKGRCFVG